MTKLRTMDGNEACSRIAYLFTEVAGIYPITPSVVEKSGAALFPY